MNKIEELQKELYALKEAEDQKLIFENYAYFKSFEGRYFKEKNSYGDGKEWWVYTKVKTVEIEELYVSSGRVLSHFKGCSFQTTTSGAIEISTNKNGYIHTLGKEISQKEFDKAFQKVKDTLNTLT